MHEKISMNVFVINSGSSSIKYQLFNMPDDNPVCSGLVERIGLEDSVITHKIFKNGIEKVIKETKALSNHAVGLEEVARLLTKGETAVISNPNAIDAVGHRIVHGGAAFREAAIITEMVKDKIKNLFALAPLHNPSNYSGIEVAEKIFTNATQVAIFDTAFHQTMPENAYLFAIPMSYSEDLNVRVYGFHGISHKYVSEQAAKYLQQSKAKIITIHLGNGCSIAAVDAGKSVDTSMGFGPLSGLIMGTRSGDIDPSVIFHLSDTLGYNLEKVKTLLNKQSGMLGLTGFSDMRDVLKAIAGGDKQAKLAYEMYAYRIKKYIGSYAAVMNGLDAIVFTAGVGENDSDIRELVCEGMSFFGIELDKQKNKIRSSEIREINSDNSTVKVLVIPTNEELEIAKQTFELINSEQ